MADSMIERVAIAIKLAQGMKPSLSGDGDLRDFELAIAKAALQVMRKPTEDMISKAIEASGMIAWDHIEPRLLDAWRAMIDAALQEKVTE